MNGVSNLKDKILEEARQKASETLVAARADAKVSLDASRQEAEKAAAAILAEADRKAGNIALRLASQRDIESRSMRLAAKREVVSKAFDLSLVTLRSMDKKTYLGWMAGMIRSAQKEAAEVILNAEDREALGAELIEAAKGSLPLTLSAQTGTFIGGFILKEGLIETNGTFEVLTGAAREDLEGEVAALLFG
ncbi:MAG TPA: V-type ATP synthase subunit E [Oscillospiraceae bacterium]|nr:V-type ATP synthase subunit E [Oscillospiraceae bacterium]HRW56824.1 V-type ATP synthase subunit E [Oscillospiraceae bacterium]